MGIIRWVMSISEIGLFFYNYLSKSEEYYDHDLEVLTSYNTKEERKEAFEEFLKRCDRSPSLFSELPSIFNSRESPVVVYESLLREFELDGPSYPLSWEKICYFASMHGQDLGKFQS